MRKLWVAIIVLFVSLTSAAYLLPARTADPGQNAVSMLGSIASYISTPPFHLVDVNCHYGICNDLSVAPLYERM